MGFAKKGVELEVYGKSEPVYRWQVMTHFGAGDFTVSRLLRLPSMSEKLLHKRNEPHYLSYQIRNARRLLPSTMRCLRFARACVTVTVYERQGSLEFSTIGRNWSAMLSPSCRDIGLLWLGLCDLTSNHKPQTPSPELFNATP